MRKLLFKVVELKTGRICTVVDKERESGELYFYVYDENINAWVWKNANCFKPL